MKWTLATSVIVVLVLGLMLVLSPGDAMAKKPPKPPPDPEPEADPAIAYVGIFKSRGVTHHKLMVMNADGSNQTVVFDGGGGISAIDWSPDGTQFVFIHQAGGGTAIKVINVDGTGLTTIFDAPNRLLPGRVAWSPGPVPGIGGDRERIAFADWNGHPARFDVHLIDPDGTDQIQLTDTYQYAEFWPTWSPSGSKLVMLVSDRADNDVTDLWSLYDFATDEYGVYHHEAPLAEQWFRGPSWSQTDEDVIAWAAAPDLYGTPNYDIWITDIQDPANVVTTRLTNTSDVSEQTVCWSEDDGAIVSMTVKIGRKVSAPRVEVIDVADPSNRQVLTENVRLPVWRR